MSKKAMCPINPIFSRNEEIDKMAFLNWRMESGEIINLFNLAEGYFQSALILTEECLKDNRDKKADIVIFPILTTFNHGIELYLKGLTLLLNKVLDNGLNVDGTHNLKQLFSTLKARIKDLDGQTALNEFEKEFIELSEYIDELFLKTEASPKNDKMDFSRYPFSKKDENHFYVDKWQNVEVDLENLHERIKSLFTKLETMSDYLYYEKYEQKY